MKKIAFIIIVLMSLMALSCRVKESCELNHTAKMAIINKYDSTLELRVNGEKVGDVDPDMVKQIARPIGQKYEINLKSYPNEWDTVISLPDECKIVEFKASKLNISSSLLNQ